MQIRCSINTLTPHLIIDTPNTLITLTHPATSQTRVLLRLRPATLYYTPTSCGAASYIAAKLGGLIGTEIIAHKVDISKHIIT